MSDGRIPREPDSMRDAQIPHDSGVGTLLRDARLQCGHDLYDVSQSLRIRYSYLEAIEKNRFRELPGPAYAIGFIRAYAEHVGLDGGEVVRRFKTGGAGVGGVSDLTFPVPVPEDGIPGGAILFVSIFVAILAYGGWYVSTSDDGFIADLISSPPETLAESGGSHTEAVAATEPGNGVQQEVGADGPAVSDPSAMEEAIKTRAMTIPAGNGQVAHPDAAGPVVAETTAAGVMPVLPAEGESPAEGETPVREMTAAETPPVDTSGSVQVLRLPPVEPPAPAPVAATQTPPAKTPPAETHAAGTEGAAENAPQAVVRSETTTTTTTTTWTATTSTAPESAPGPQPASVAGSAPSAPIVETVEVAGIPEAPDTQAVEPSQARVLGDETGNSRIVVRAKVNSWIQIRDDVANQLLVTRLLRAGDTYQVPDRTGLKLLTGNAGALEIVVDGVQAPPIGPMGAVRRDVALDADSLMTGTAVRQ